MKNKYQRMNEFFNFLSRIIQENPNIDLEKDPRNILYSILVYYDTKKEDNQVTLDKQGIFENWERRLSSKNKVTIDPDNTYIEIENMPNKPVNNRYYISVFVPLKQQQIEDGTNLIIDFFNREKISYSAKISKKIKSDGVVINLLNTSDVEKLCNFIKQNQTLKKGLLSNNPFIYSHEGIAMTTGNQFSYNVTLVQYIKIYLSERKKQNQLNLISLQDFTQFMKEYYENVFINYSKLNDYINRLQIPNNQQPNRIADYMNITELIIKNLDPEFMLENSKPKSKDKKSKQEFEEFKEHYKKYKDSYFYNSVVLNFGILPISEQEIEATNRLLIKLFEIMTLEHSEEAVIANLAQFIFESDTQLITRKEELRTKVANSSFASNMKYILRDKGMTLAQYIQSFNLKKKDDNELKEEVDTILESALTQLCSQDSLKSAIESLHLFLNDIDSAVTNKNNLRVRLLNSLFKDKMLLILNKTGLSFEEYVHQLNIERRICLEEYVEQAITATYIGYRESNEEGPYTCEQNTIFTINGFLYHNKYIAFSAKAGARQPLQENAITRKELLLTMKNILVKEGIIKEEDIKDYHDIAIVNLIVEQYVELVKQKYEESIITKKYFH